MLLVVSLPSFLENSVCIRLCFASDSYWLCVPDLTILAGYYGTERRVQRLCTGIAESYPSAVSVMGAARAGDLRPNRCWFCRIDQTGRILFLEQFLEQLEPFHVFPEHLEALATQIHEFTSQGNFNKITCEKLKQPVINAYLKEIRLKLSFKLNPLKDSKDKLRQALSSKKIRPEKFILCDAAFTKKIQRQMTLAEKVFFYERIAVLVENEIDANDKYRLTRFSELIEKFIIYVFDFNFWEREDFMAI